MFRTNYGQIVLNWGSSQKRENSEVKTVPNRVKYRNSSYTNYAYCAPRNAGMQKIHEGQPVAGTIVKNPTNIGKISTYI